MNPDVMINTARINNPPPGAMIDKEDLSVRHTVNNSVGHDMTVDATHNSPVIDLSSSRQEVASNKNIDNTVATSTSSTDDRYTVVQTLLKDSDISVDYSGVTDYNEEENNYQGNINQPGGMFVRPSDPLNNTPEVGCH